MVTTNLNLLQNLKSIPLKRLVALLCPALPSNFYNGPEPSKLHVCLNKGFSDSIEISFESALLKTTELSVPRHNFHF